MPGFPSSHDYDWSTSAVYPDRYSLQWNCGMTNTLTAQADTARPGIFRRWAPPEGEPAYARPALAVILILAAVLFAWGINRADYHSFYADAVRSMTESWKAFFFGSFDSGSAITVDKIPGFLWPQAISARIFGFHPWSLILPQVIEGVISVFVLYQIVRRWAGVNAALLASASLLTTPVIVGLFRTAVEDPMYTMCVLLAALATQRAASSGRVRSLVMAGVWVGIGFQAKIVLAWAVLPALALVYLVAAPTPLRKRLLHLGAAGLATLIVSASWITIVTLTPASDRPYIDGTTNNSVVSMAFGYNFLNRFSNLGISASSTGSVSSSQTGAPAAPAGGAAGAAGGAGAAAGAGGAAGAGAAGAHAGAPGATQGGASSSAAPSTGAAQPHGSSSPTTGAGSSSAGSGAGSGAGASAGAGAGFPGGQNAPPGFGQGGPQSSGGSSQQSTAAEDGWGKMFGIPLATQVGWLYPLAFIGLAFGLIWRRREPRTDPIRAGFLLWGGWLAMYFLAFSAGSVAGHVYYMGVVAMPLAALAGGGIAFMWRSFRARERAGWALPISIAATAGWTAYMSSQFPNFESWLEPTAIVLAVVSVVLFTAMAVPRSRLTSRSGRIATVGLITGLAAVLLTPAAWASQIFSPSYQYNMVGALGPSASNGGVAAFLDTSGVMSTEEKRILTYAQAHSGGAEYVLATTNWVSAYPFILSGGAHVLAMGGFTDDAPFPTVSGFEQLAHSGKVRFLLTGGAPNFGSVFGATLATNTTNAIAAWARTACVPVTASNYGGVPQADISTAPSPNPFAIAPLALYDCAGK